MGRFCLTAQATILLGRVLHVIHHNPESEQVQPSQIQVLDNTLEALPRIALEKVRSRGVGVCSPTTVCYNARFLLHDRERRGAPPPDGPTTFEETVADSMLRLAHIVGSAGTCGTEEISTFA